MRVTYRNEILMPDSPFACEIYIAGVSTYAQSIMYCNVLALSLFLTLTHFLYKYVDSLDISVPNKKNKIKA